MLGFNVTPRAPPRITMLYKVQVIVMRIAIIVADGLTVRRKHAVTKPAILINNNTI